MASIPGIPNINKIIADAKASAPPKPQVTHEKPIGDVSVEERELVEVYGIVTEVEKATKIRGVWSDPKFTILAPRSNIEFKAHATVFCRVQPEDRIYAVGYYYVTNYNGKEEHRLHVSETPVIEPGVTKNCIIQTFHKAMPRKGRLAGDIANKIYEDLVVFTKKISCAVGVEPADRVNLYMTNISNKLNKAGKELGDDVIEPFLNHLEKEDALKLIRYWFSNREKRKLQMLGLKDKDIKESIYPTDILYQKVRENPYTVPCISLEDCYKLMLRFGTTPTDHQVRRGEILRYVYQNTMMSGWSCTPMPWLRDKYPDIGLHLEALQAEIDPEGETPYGYNMYMDRVNEREYMYMKDIYKIETSLSTTFASVIRQHGLSKFGGKPLDDIPLELPEEPPENLPETPSEAAIAATSGSPEIAEDPVAGTEGIVDHVKSIGTADFVPVFRCKTLSSDQKTAITGALNHPISVITGGGGTGKTTSIVEIVTNLEMHNINFAICSYTGKAVSRVREVLRKGGYSEVRIGKLTFTLHRGIYSSMDDDGDLTHLIIDETSMVTTGLIYEFLTRYPLVKWMTFVGDCNQLLPIGWGCFFKELITSRCIPVYYLTNNHRTYKTGQTDGICLNAERLTRDIRVTDFKFAEETNFRLVDGEENQVLTIVNQIKEMGVSDHQITVVTPFNKSKTSCNHKLAALFRPKAKSVKDTIGNVWRLGDRVLMTENNYDIDVMNGDEGRIIEISAKSVRIGFSPQALTEWVDGCDINTTEFNHLKKRSFNFKTFIPHDDPYGGFKYEKRVDEGPGLHLGMVDLSYAMTVHKSQGSEWDYVIFYVPGYARPSKSFLNRNLVYTGMTRGKAFVVIIGNTGEITRACNTKPAYRCENLASRLRLALPDLTAAAIQEDVPMDEEFIYDDPDENYFFEEEGDDVFGDDW